MLTPKLETIQMSFSMKMVKQSVAHTHHGTLLSHKNGGATDNTYDNLDELPENEGYFINLLLKVAKSQFVLVDLIHKSEFGISLIWPLGCYFQYLFLL